MLFSWRKFLAGPVVKNAVQKDPWSPWEHTEFLQCWTRENDLPNAIHDQLQVGHSHITLRSGFSMQEEKELGLELLQNEKKNNLENSSELISKGTMQQTAQEYHEVTAHNLKTYS